MAQSVLGAERPRGAPHPVFRCIKQARSWDTQRVLCGISGPAVPWLLTATDCDPLSPGQVRPCVGAQVRLWDLWDEHPAPVLALGLAQSRPFPGTRVQPGPGGHPELPLSTESSCCAPAQPGDTSVLWAAPAPHTRPQPRAVFVSHPPSPSRWSCQCDNAVQCCYRSHMSVVNVNGRNMVNMDTFSFQM